MRPLIVSIGMLCFIGGMVNGGGSAPPNSDSPPKSDSPKDKSWDMKLVEPKQPSFTWLAVTKEPVRDLADGELGKPLKLALSKVAVKGAQNVSVRVYASSEKSGDHRELVGELFFFPSGGNVDAGYVADIAPALKKLASAGTLRRDRPLILLIEPSQANPDRPFELKKLTVEKATLSRRGE